MFIILVVILVVVWAQNILFGRHAIKHSIQNMMKYGGNYPNNISRNKVDPLMTSSSLKPKKISASSKSETDSVFSDPAYVPGQEFIKKVSRDQHNPSQNYFPPFSFFILMLLLMLVDDETCMGWLCKICLGRG